LAIAGISVNDVDGNLSTVQLTVSNGVLNVTLNGASIAAGSNASANLTLSGTQTEINAALATLTYRGNEDFNGADTLTVLSTDSSAASRSDTLNITVNPVNDAPTFRVGDGIVTTDIAGNLDTGYSVAIQSDGKLVVAGFGRNGSDAFALTRYHVDGRLDTIAEDTTGDGTFDSKLTIKKK